MRRLVMGATLALALLAAPAQAQSGDPFVGTWAFQTATRPFTETSSTMLTGTAIVSAPRGGHYQVQVVVHEFFVSNTGQVRVNQPATRQACEGRADGGALALTCTLIEAPPDYGADTFDMHSAGPDRLGGNVNQRVASFVRVR